MDNPFQHVLRLHVSLHLHCVPSPVLKKVFNAPSCDTKKQKNSQLNATYSINPCIRSLSASSRGKWHHTPLDMARGYLCVCHSWIQFTSIQFSGCV